MDEKQHIIFDLDGTLIETRERHWRVYKRVTLELGGKPLPLPVYWRLKRKKQSTLYLVKKSGLPKKYTDQYLKRFITLIEKPDYQILDTCFPFTHTVLNSLAYVYRLHLVTVRRDKKALLGQLKRLSLTKYFSTTLAQAPAGDPAQTKKVLIQSLHIAPIMVIGDTEADIETATLLGTKSIGVASGIRTASVLKRTNPTHIVGDIRGVLRIIRQIQTNLPAGGPTNE